MNGNIFHASLLACSLVIAPAAHAVTFCVSNANELEIALNLSGNNGQDDLIRIAPGTYTENTGLAAFGWGTSENFDLEIEGGWIPVGMVGCQIRVNNPMLTILTAGGNRRVLRIVPGPGTSGTLEIANLTVQDGDNVTEDGGGIKIGSTAASHNILLERIFFYNNAAQLAGGALSVHTMGQVSLRNNVFFANQSGIGGAASVLVNHANSTDVRAQLINNTVIANSCTGSGACPSGGFALSGTARTVVASNAFVVNEDIDVSFGGASADLFGNNIDAFSGTPANAGRNISVDDPRITDALGLNFRLLDDSPLIDTGAGGYSPGSTDFYGNPRLNGQRYDIGAIENQINVFGSGFEVLL